MSFFGDIAEGGLTGLLKGAGTFAKDVRTAITGKEILTAAQQTELLSHANALETLALNIEAQASKGQIDLNLADASSGSLFKGGWRPSIGWVCSAGLAYSFLLKPLLPWCVNVVCLIFEKSVVIPPMPALDIKELIALTLALLGFGGYRMYEKVKGVASRK
jgi:hypothetical protein